MTIGIPRKVMKSKALESVYFFPFRVHRSAFKKLQEPVWQDTRSPTIQAARAYKGFHVLDPSLWVWALGCRV